MRNGDLTEAKELSILCNFILGRASQTYDLDLPSCVALSSRHEHRVIGGKTFIAIGYYSYSQICISKAICNNDHQIIIVEKDNEVVFECEWKDAEVALRKYRFLDDDLEWREDINYFASLVDRGVL